MVNNSEPFPVHTRLCIILPAAAEGHFFYWFLKYRRLSAAQFSALINKTICESCFAAHHSYVLCAVGVWLPPLRCRSAPYFKRDYFGGRRCGKRSDAKGRKKIELICIVTRALEECLPPRLGAPPFSLSHTYIHTHFNCAFVFCQN